MESKIRIAVRKAATELSAADIDRVAGGMQGSGTITNTPMDCHVDTSTDCIVSGGAYITNDDAS